MKEKFDLIIFDWDGTLVDSIDWIVHCLQKAAEIHDFPVPDVQVAKSTIGLCIQQAMTTLFPGVDEKTQEQLCASYSQEFFSLKVNEEHLFSGVSNMLVELRNKQYQLAIATGKTRAGLDFAMQGTGLADFFDITRCADESASKPQPVMLEQIISAMGVNRERAVMIGDSVHDIEMANNAGIAAIAVSCGANTEHELQQFDPVLNLTKTVELLKFL